TRRRRAAGCRWAVAQRRCDAGRERGAAHRWPGRGRAGAHGRGRQQPANVAQRGHPPGARSAAWRGSGHRRAHRRAQAVREPRRPARRPRHRPQDAGAALAAGRHVSDSVGAFVAWPVPAACGAAAGALLGAWWQGGVGETLAIGLLIGGLVCAASLVMRRWRPKVRPPRLARRQLRPPRPLSSRPPLSVHRSPRFGALLLTLLAFLCATLRYELWEHAENPASPHFGVEQRWAGEYDGVHFRASAPVEARFALVSPVDLRPGHLE